MAKKIGVHKATVQNWERNVGTPLPAQIPAIIRFLGYAPFKHDDTLQGKLRWLRTAAGWTQEDWADAAGVDAVTIGRWEAGKGIKGSSLISNAFQYVLRQLVAMGLEKLVSSELRSLKVIITPR